jgi:Ras-related GTP-binding protein C/D
MLPQVIHIKALMDNLVNASRIDNAFLFDVLSKTYIAKDATPDEHSLYEICSELIDVLIDVTCIYGMEEGGSFKFDKDSASVIKLEHPDGKENNIVIYLKEVEKCLALVLIIKETEFAQKQLIDYNIDKFKEGLTELFMATERATNE